MLACTTSGSLLPVQRHQAAHYGDARDIQLRGGIYFAKCVVLVLYRLLFMLAMHVQTLLKTTNHILIHDVKGSLAHLHSLVQRGVSPNNHLCIICSRRADSLADGSKDDVVVFT
jgi:hypothetical protein